MQLTKLYFILIPILGLSGCVSNQQPLNVPKSVLKTNAPGTIKNKVVEGEKSNDILAKYTLLQGIEAEKEAALIKQNQSSLLPNLSDENNIKIAINEMQLNDFIHLVYGEHLGLSYVLDDGINKQTSVTMTLNMQETISQKKLFDLANQLLSKNNVQFDNQDAVLFFYINKNNSSKGRFNLGVGRELADLPEQGEKRIAQLVPILYGNWSSLSNVVSSLLNIRTRWVSEHNSVLAIGSREEISQFIRLINTFDVPDVKNKFIGLHEFTYINVDEFTEQLTQLMQAEGIEIDGKEPKLVLTPLLQRNAIIIHSATQLLLERVSYWAKQLDKPSPTSKKRYYTFNPSNANVNDIGESISSLIALQTGQVNPAANKKSNSATNKKQASQNKSKNNAKSGGAGIATNELSMMVDPHQNALIFYTTPAKYQEILPLLNQMDVIPKQVVIEATVAEVTLSDSYKQGIEWFLNNSLGENGFTRNINMKSGLTFSLANVDYSVILSLLESESRVNVVSNPRLVVKDGEAASINVGSQVPILTQQSSNTNGDGDQIIQSVQYQSTGVSLNVTPTISADGVVSMVVNQSVTDATPNELSDISSPVISNRSISTTVLAKSGQTIVLGGLISENINNSDSGVPFFMDLPIIGNLFKSKSDGKSRVELVILLTPKVIASGNDVDNLINDYSQNLPNITFN